MIPLHEVEKSKDFWLLTGPTASGKTEFAHFCYRSEKFSYIINADSRQFYKELNIGTAKVDLQSEKEFNYCLLNFLEIRDSFSCYKFHQKLASFAKKDCISENKKPSLVVGGPSLYTGGLFFNLPEIKTPSEIRKKVEKYYQEGGLDGLLKIIAQQDPEYYIEMDKKNPRRALRAIEVMEITKKPYSTVRKSATATKYSTLTLYLLWSRKELYERIEKRTFEMMKQGWMEESEFLWKKYPANVLDNIDAVGYRHLFDALKKKISQEEAIKKIITDTWHLAKKQMTWIKKQLRQKDNLSLKNKIIFFLGDMEKIVKTKKNSLKNSFFHQKEIEQMQDQMTIFFKKNELKKILSL